MKRFFAAAVAACLLLAAGGCARTSGTGISGHTEIPATQATAGEESLSIVATIFPGYDFARQVAGEEADIVILLPPGAESHSYEPTPQDIIRIQSCDLFVYVGGESEHWVNEILGSMGDSGPETLAMMEIVDVVEEEITQGMEHDHDGHDHEDDHEHGGEAADHAHEDGHEDHEDGDGAYAYDEHVWTDPRNAKTIVQSIADSLAGQDAAKAETYRENAEAYEKQLDALDAQLREVVDGAARRTLVFGDRFPFRYFTDAYGLDYYAAYPGCSTQTEPSAKTVSFLIDKVKEERIPAVLHIEFSNERMADAICAETGAKKLLLHSCHNVTPRDMADGVTYLQLMERNVESLREALR